MSEHPCTTGHQWRHIGGSNCGCHPDSACSVPVHECAACGEFDYGDNAEAGETRGACPEVEECRAKAPAYEGLQLTQAEFDALDEYSATLPTGQTPGKRWKRHDGAFDREFLDAGGKPVWLIGEFGEVSADGKTVALNWYVPVIVVPGSAMVSEMTDG
ncbi:MAG: hypothetical protein EOS72_03330 [Mesorhizobium sp.]|uniref:hypothetical protein n=1 Tax=Mesorhizobium sp. TaxID=1871066 RepID=UPI000FE96B8C|nr:hypothetical protein [Mesorhizobium sp.]RWC91701.1 MAG: hypothetical protein EOS72_03330 [Mesorhizobium sp.]